MTSKAKAKGYGFERELVEQLKLFNCESVMRAFGSDGRSFNEAPDIDIKATTHSITLKIQAKRRKALPKFLQPGNANVVAIREDRGRTYYILEQSFFFQCLAMASNKKA